ncbi:dynamin family protein [Gordonia alkanivorans]|uniref:dynamin family protein n=1 Tax=Gordonia alkanivorans TaxID=84096 RepID=UPI0013E30BFD|nr:dynamin family protein [Gordonia alkanivorans]
MIDIVTSLLTSAASVVKTTDEKRWIDQLAERLVGVPTIGLAGRVSSGKSTLVNALVGAQVAPTDAGECTRVATLYECGAPECFDVIGFGGQRLRLPELAPAQLGMPLDDIDFAVAYTPQSRLRDRYRVIDTPGLSSHEITSERATRRALVDHGGLPQPEVTLFLVEGGHVRQDEAEFMRAMGASRVNTILVISRADIAGDGVMGEEDPFDVATRHAQRLLHERRDLASAAIPVAGLMAESAEVGISEHEAATLARLDGVDEFDLMADIDGGSADPTLMNLYTKIGLYGVVHGRLAASGGAIRLSDWLIERSGLQALHRAIDDRFRLTGPVLKARTALDALQHQAWRSSARAEILTLIEEAELDPRLHCLREVVALDRLVQSAPTSPLLDELERLLHSDNTESRVGVAAGSGADEIRDAAIQRISSCRTMKLTTFSGVEREALTVLERSYQLAMGEVAR